MSATVFAARGEPTTDDARHAVEAARDAGCDLVVAVGGGSPLDLGKAAAALLANGGDPLDYLEVIGRGRPLALPSVPFLALPTTAGTGSEVTRNAVLSSPEHGVKASLRSPFMLPRQALVDPDLTLDVPPAVTAATGLDALTQLVEPFVCSRSNPLVDALCREGMTRVARSLRRAVEQGSDRAAREDLALASLFGGLALANAGLGVVHGFAAVIGGAFGAPHGAVCARLLGPTSEANARALVDRGSPGASARYDEVARILTGSAAGVTADGVAWIERLCRDFAVPRLGIWGMTERDVPGVVQKALAASSTRANPIPLTAEEMAGILFRSL